MSKKVSPLAPAGYPQMPPVPGIVLATAEAGIKYRGRTDVLYAGFSENTAVAGVFTRSKCPSAAVEWCRANLGRGGARALVVNSGNANAFTGVKGASSVAQTADIAARAAGCTPQDVFIASTGVIGEPLAADKFEGVLADCAARAAPDAWDAAARAIMTTDTFPKYATRTVLIGDCEVVINGIAKGSGMIAPDMATMLAFVFTDAPIAQAALQTLIANGADRSFNCVTVDGDTSTSDTLMLFATGEAASRGAPKISDADDPQLKGFREALDGLLIELAQWVARDGEGASKFVTIDVAGAVSDASAKTIAMAIANSPLVKTAIAGEDPNWGRIVMAVGKAGEPADRDRLAIHFGDIRVAVDGERDPAYVEEKVAAVMREQDIAIRVDIGLGEGRARVWTCDLTKDYIAINADYRS